MKRGVFALPLVYCVLTVAGRAAQQHLQGEPGQRCPDAALAVRDEFPVPLEVRLQSRPQGIVGR